MGINQDLDKDMKHGNVCLNDLMEKYGPDFEYSAVEKDREVEPAPRYRVDERLRRGLYYTQEEWKKRIEYVKSLELPK